MSREIKFRVWDKKFGMMYGDGISVQGDGTFYLERADHDGNEIEIAESEHGELVLMQFTGLLDKNDLEDIYEGDILAPDGTIAGNRYEDEDLLKDPAYLLIEGMGTGAWRDAEQAAVERGCQYAQ